VFVCCLIDFVVALGLEVEVPDLPADHGNEPANQRRSGRIGEQQHVGAQEADRAQ
jgi:hypothetical protein